MSRLAIRTTFSAVTGTVLALVVIAAALNIAAAYPTLDALAIAVATGMGIGVIALAVTIATAVLRRLRLPSNNNAWVLW